jgi:hypothetical protein
LILLLIVFWVTVAHVLYVRMQSTPEGSLELSSEAVWGMIAFATLPVLASYGGLRAAWEARQSMATAPWDEIKVDAIGGSA